MGIDVNAAKDNDLLNLDSPKGSVKAVIRKKSEHKVP